MAYEIETRTEDAFLSTPQRMWDLISLGAESEEQAIEKSQRWEIARHWISSLLCAMAAGCGRSSLED